MSVTSLYSKTIKIQFKLNSNECKALKFLKISYFSYSLSEISIKYHDNKFNFFFFLLFSHFCSLLKGGKNSRGIRVSSYDPDESNQSQTQNYSTTGSTQQQQQPQSQYQQQPQTYNGSSSEKTTVTAPPAPPTLGSSRKFSQKVATISQNYNEKSMLLSSDEEYQ